jgi:excisionase family DNA binding protein
MTPTADLAPDTSARSSVRQSALSFLTVSAVACALGVRRGKILNWIARGELVGVNIADRATGRPRWRIPQAALDSFLAMRSCRPPDPVRRVRRPKPDANYVEYF